jgi:hypothetical protein
MDKNNVYQKLFQRCWPYGHQRPPLPVNTVIHPAEKDFGGSGGNTKVISSSSSPPPASMLDLSKVCEEKELRWKPVHVGPRRAHGNKETILLGSLVLIS